MSNMSYCRFHNTAMALQDCVEVLLGEDEHYQGVKDLSREEKVAYRNLLELCQSYLDASEEFEERESNEQEEDDE